VGDVSDDRHDDNHKMQENLLAKEKLFADMEDSTDSEIYFDEPDVVQSKIQTKKNARTEISKKEKAKPHDDLAEFRVDLDPTPTNSDTESVVQPKKNRKKRVLSDNDNSMLEQQSDVSESSNSRRTTRSSAKRENMQNRRSKRARRLMSDSSDSSIRKDSGTTENDDVIILIDEETTTSKGRKKIRKLIDDDKLEAETREAQSAERNRLERLRKKDASLLQSPEKNYESIFMDFDEKQKKPLLEIDRPIAKNLKKHQIDGIKFMWSSCYESVECIRDNRVSGGGCVLAHCMGLG
jgi:transcriptional regulator ATRX